LIPIPPINSQYKDNAKYNQPDKEIFCLFASKIACNHPMSTPFDDIFPFPGFNGWKWLQTMPHQINS